MGTTVIVSLVVYALLETLIDLFLQGSVWISQMIMNSSITVFSTDQNILKSFYELLPLGFSTSSGEKMILDLDGLVSGISVALLVLIVTTSAIRSFTAPLTGENVENPAQVAIRAVTALVLKVLIFGTSLFSFNGLLGYIGQIFTVAMSYVGVKIAELTPTLSDYIFGDFSVTLNPAAYIGLLILSASLITAVLGAAITYVERILTFVASLLVGPIAVMLYASSKESKITETWLRSIFAQLGAILLSLIMWALFLAQLKEALHGEGVFFDLAGKEAGVRIFKLAIAIAILSLVRNSEKIFNNMGIRTMPNTESARALFGGLSAVGTGLLATRRAASVAVGGVNTMIHGGKSAMAKGGSNGGIGATTGNSLFNSKGEMSVNFEGNKARQVLANMNQAGINAPLFGKDSVHSMQSRQATAINHMASQVKQGSAGTVIPGISAKYGSEVKNFSSAQTANMALSGRSEGTGRFAFISTNQTVTSGEPNGRILQPSVRIAETSSLDGSSVRGFVGAASYSSNGIDTARGEYFVPTENGLSELAVGQLIDTGTGVDMQITGSRIAIDDFGGYAYEIRPVENLDAVTQEEAYSSIVNISNILEEHFANEESITESPKEILSQQDYGIENIDDGESYDPN